jgi:hypothetical protein
VNLIEQQSGKFEPQKLPNEYARAVHELVQAKIEQRAPEVEIETETREAPKVINIMDALKKSMQAKSSDKSQRRGSQEDGKGRAKTRSDADRPSGATNDTQNRALIFASTDKFPAHLLAQVSSVFFTLCLNYGARRAVECAKTRKLDLNPIHFQTAKSSNR